MSDDRPLGDRRKALEDSFFAKENERALERMRKDRQAKADRDELSAVTGLKDEALLDGLLELGFRAETLAALSLYPLVAVAWADRRIAASERRAILAAAREQGLSQDDSAFALLERWLETRPSESLLGAWKDLVNGLKSSLSGDALEALRGDVMGRAEEVAKAAGGVLGLGPKISDDEQAVLDELAEAFR